MTYGTQNNDGSSFTVEDTKDAVDQIETAETGAESADDAAEVFEAGDHGETDNGRPQVGSKATLAVIAGDKLIVEGDQRGFADDEFQYLQTNPLIRMLQLRAVGNKFAKGAEALGLTEVDGEIAVIRFTPREEDAEGYLIDGTGLEEGTVLDLDTVEFTRVF